MKSINIFLFVFLLAFSLSGQDIVKNFSLSSANLLSIETDYPSLVIRYGTSNSVKLEGGGTFNGKPVTDVFSFHWDQTSSKLRIETDIENLKNQSSAYNYKGNKYGNWDFDPAFTVYIPSSIQSLKVKSTYGALNIDELPEETEIHNTYGSIEASSKKSLKTCKLTATYSTITLNVPESTKAEVELRSDYGEIYTDLDIEIDKQRSVNKMFKTIIVGNINASSQNKVNLRSDYSNIYLRKM